MDTAPPVPPKDTPRKTQLQRTESSSAPTSASKRKRDEYAEYASEDDFLGHSPKRHRKTPPTVDTDASETASLRGRSTLRRKKGVNNLSSLKLRHKAEQARINEEQPRESRFQEGSLTGKPSQKPPSAFTRIISTDSGQLDHVDSLMADYHNDMPTPGNSNDGIQVGESFETFQSTAGAEQPSSFYRFGQKLATGFRPVALWNKIWNETKEELTQKNMEIELRRRQKIEAEKQYAQMKQAGQLPTKHSRFGSISQRASGKTAFSPVIITDTEDSERTLRGRMHFTRPSLSNLRLNLKRTRSDANLVASSNHESSTSVSPVKADGEATELHKSQSRIELKKQHKLSKRVSDLETKLNVARRELDEALIDASPNPRLGSRYERFTPLSTIKRTFVPGFLPTLPSERLLDAEAVHYDQPAEDEATVRASRGNAYPRRAADLFDDEDTHKNNDVRRMDPAAIVDGHSSPTDIAAATPPTSDDISRDAQVSKRLFRSKKRKSGPLDDAQGIQDEDNGVDIGQRKKVVKKRKSAVSAQEEKQTVEEQAYPTMHGDLEEQDMSQDYTDNLAQFSTKDNGDASVRLSMDSATRSLDPVYEEEETVMTIPLNDDPPEPTAIATPARFGQTTRSMSPVKRSHVKAKAEELVITRAADAVKHNPARQARSRNSAKGIEYEWPDDVF